MAVEVSIRGPAIRGLSREVLTSFIRSCLAALRRSKVLGERPDEVSIAFVDDTVMRRLNRQFRGKNRTTDVLTFESGPEDVLPGEPRSLGEIVISQPQAQRQAREQRHSLAVEVRYLVLHGLIHALGYDHETDDGEMDALELAVRSRVGLR